jgi:S-adenosylmethionine:tRNA ribosyltransferase-isomerase
MSTRTADYDFTLPEELIARYPPERREDARMMVLHRSSGVIEHRGIVDLPEYLRRDDLAVLNDTRVTPARLISDDRRIELLLLARSESSNAWRCLVKPGKRMRTGHAATFGGHTAVVIETLPSGDRVVQFPEGVDPLALGEMPLPMYLCRESTTLDRSRYQTVFARAAGAVAAPTAGLHFTSELLARIPHAFVTLHVGPGTFRPVKTENVEEHVMHVEEFVLPQETADRINAATRILAVGTTTVRVLESCASEAPNRRVTAGAGTTDIFIYPPHQFRTLDLLLTNFHLPRSTLLMLVAAFAGIDFLRAAYDEAIRQRYRFYSYGDCMLII